MYERPNSSYSWIVLCACFVINVLCDGVLYAYGAMKNYIEDYFNTTQVLSAAVGSAANGVYLLCGPLASLLVNKFGHRKVSLLGSATAAAFMCLSVFSPNIYAMIILYGICGGVGFGLIYLPAISAVSLYFRQKTALAMSVNVAGSGIGTIIFAPLAAALFEEFGWKGGMFILAGLVFNCAVCGALIRPVRNENKVDTAKTDIDKEESNCCQPLDEATKESLVNDNKNAALPGDNATQSRELRSMKSFLCDRSLLLICVGNVFSMVGYYIPYVFLSSMAESMGMQRSRTALLISIIGLTNTVSRPVSGCIVEYLPSITALDLNNVSLLSSALVTLPISLYGRSGLFVYAGLFGFLIAPHVSMTPVLLGDLFGTENVSTTFGLCLFFRGVTTAISPVLCGLLIERTGSYTSGFWLCSASLLVSAVLHFFVTFLYGSRHARK